MRNLPILAALILIAVPASAADTLDFEGTEIIGEVQKPEVTVVISRENLNKSYNLELDESFLKKIVESVDHPPF